MNVNLKVHIRKRIDNIYEAWDFLFSPYDCKKNEKIVLNCFTTNI